MGILQDAIAGFGQVFGGKPKEAQDFWDRIYGSPLWKQQMQNKDKDLEMQRLIQEHAANAKTDTGEHKPRTDIDTVAYGNRADIDAQNYAKRAGIDLSNIQPRILNTGLSYDKLNTILQNQQFGDLNNPNPLISNAAKSALYKSAADKMNAEQAQTVAQSDPALGTAAGLSYNMGRAGYGHAQAAAKGQELVNSKLEKLLPLVEPQATSEIDQAKAAAELARASAAEKGAEGSRLMSLLPMQQELLKSQAGAYEALSHQREDKVGQPIRAGGNSVLEPYIDANGVRQYRWNNPYLNMGSNNNAPPAAVDMNKLQQILESKRTRQ